MLHAIYRNENLLLWLRLSLAQNFTVLYIPLKLLLQYINNNNNNNKTLGISFMQGIYTM